MSSPNFEIGDAANRLTGTIQDHWRVPIARSDTEVGSALSGNLDVQGMPWSEVKANIISVVPGSTSFFVAGNYAGSKDPATDCSASVYSFINAAIASIPAAKGKLEFHFGPGWINLANWTSIILTNKVIEFHFHGTQVVWGIYPVAGTGRYPTTFRTPVGLGKNSGFSAYGYNGATWYGFDNAAAFNTTLYSSAADWGSRVLPFRLHGIRMVDSRKGYLQASLDSNFSAEETNRKTEFAADGTTEILVTTSLTGDGSTTKTIALNALPLRNDPTTSTGTALTGASAITVASVASIQVGRAIVFNVSGTPTYFRVASVVGLVVNLTNLDGTAASLAADVTAGTTVSVLKFEIGDTVFFETQTQADGVPGFWQGTLAGYDTATSSLIFDNAVTSGVIIPGSYASTTTAAVNAGETKIPMTIVAELFVEQYITVTYSDNTTLFTQIVRIDGTNIYIRDVLQKGVSNGGNVTAIGSRAIRKYTPAISCELIDIQDCPLTVLPINSSSNFLNFGNTGLMTVDNVVLQNLWLSGAKELGIWIGTTNRLAEFYQKKFFARNIEVTGFGLVQGASGGSIVHAGFQESDTDWTGGGDEVSLNEISLVVNRKAVIGQNWVQVAQDLTGVSTTASEKCVPSCGYSVNANGESIAVALTATLVNTATTTTISNGGPDVAAGVTALPVASEASFQAGDVVRVTAGGNIRYYGVSSTATGILNIQEATDGAIVDGATVTRMVSQNTNPAARGSANNTNRLRMVLDKPEYPTGFEMYFNIVAVDTSRGVGLHRIYFTGTGSTLATKALSGTIPAGRGIHKIDMNGLPNNGAELFYGKNQNSRHRNIWSRNSRSGHLAIATLKGGEFGKQLAAKFGGGGGAYANSRGWGNLVSGLNVVDTLVGPVKNVGGCGIFIQCSDTCIVDSSVEGSINGAVNIHNGTLQHNVGAVRVDARDFQAQAAFRIFAPGGRGYYVQDCKARLHSNAQTLNGVYGINLSLDAWGGDLWRSHFEDIEIDKFIFDSTRMLKEDIDLATPNRRGACINITNANTALGTDMIMRKILIKGKMGRSNHAAFLRLAGKGRIGGIIFGEDLDVSGYRVDKKWLIHLGTDSAGAISGVNRATPTISTTNASATATVSANTNLEVGWTIQSANVPAGTKIIAINGTTITMSANATSTASGTAAVFAATRLEVAAVADDASITIPVEHAFNIPAGSAVKINLDSGSVHDTWTRADSIAGSGVLQLMDPIPSAAAQYKAVSIRPIGHIELLNPKSIGYAYETVILSPVGADTVTLDIAGIFPCFNNSPGAPRAESVYIRAIQGESDDYDFRIDHPVITPNNTSQTGGSIVWDLLDRSSGSAHTLATATKFVVGYREPYVRFNQ